MLSPTEVAPASLRAAVGGLHQPRAAAGDHREPGLADRPADLAGPAYSGSSRGCGPSRTRRPRARRSRERLEALAQLALDQRRAAPASVRVEATCGDSAQMISSFGRARVGSGCGSFIAASASRPRPRLPWQVLMEASERPQLPFDEPTPATATVRVVDDRLVIERLTVADAGAARVVREQHRGPAAAAETVTAAIEIGARVIDSEGTAANVDYVRRELEAGLGELDRKLGGTLDEGAEALAERIAATFGAERNDSVQAQIKEIVTGGAPASRAAVCTLTAEDASNPLVAMQVRIDAEAPRGRGAPPRRGREAARVARDPVAGDAGPGPRAQGAPRPPARQGRARARARRGRGAPAPARASASRSASTRRSRRSPASRGDVATHTGGEQAEGGGKKGDTLVEIGACEGSAQGRIVFEAKDKQLSKNEAWAELNAAMEARAASFGGARRRRRGERPVRARAADRVRGQQADRRGRSRRARPGSGSAIAYRLAAARVAMARDRDLQVDAIAVRDTAAEAITLLKQAQAIRSAMTGIKTSSDKARAGPRRDGRRARGEAAADRRAGRRGSAEARGRARPSQLP